MKKTIFIMAGMALSVCFMTASAQETNTWDPKKNPTVDSINAKHRDKIIPPREAMTVNMIFPALGQYESSVNTDAPSVTISLDPTNKGVVWIEGLPQGRIKAMLRKSPSTYKIPAQKTEEGKDVAEGTLIFDKETNTLSIAIGKPYNAEDPGAAFLPAAVEEPVAAVKTTKSKSKAKVKVAEKPKPWMYAGTKIESATVKNQ
ncbi:MAG TPA: hypothetical protein VF476_00430 [Chitinophagaceae bacterium]